MLKPHILKLSQYMRLHGTSLVGDPKNVSCAADVVWNMSLRKFSVCCICVVNSGECLRRVHKFKLHWLEKASKTALFAEAGVYVK
jgi:hypothetical protein